MKKMTSQVWKGFIALLALLLVADSQQDQSGFISIDCGTNASYTDQSTTINYSPDSQYIESGINMDISALYENYTLLQQQLNNVRSFPEGTKNCYTLDPPQGKNTSYLIRAYFMYGNYDSLDKPPTFDLYLGVDLWETVKLENASQIVSKEIIHAPSRDYLYVCLANIGSGTPFISGLELRHLNDSIYTRQSGSLDLLHRYYTYTTSVNHIRYNNDIYDRIWEPAYLPGGTSINTTREVNSVGSFNLPSSVMQAAMTPTNLSSKPLSFTYTFSDPDTEFYIYLHMAELRSLGSRQVREFNITVNGQHFYGPYVPFYLTSQTIYSPTPIPGLQLNVTFQSTKRSTLPPILNAVEIFTAKHFSQDSTNPLDVDAIMEIKSSYDLTKNWQGDPCVPQTYSWAGVNCSYDSSTSPRITALNLSSSGLTGDIPDSVSNLTALQILDLSNNKLSGQIPDFLSDLPVLKTLNLARNNFSGPVPEKLLERSRDGSLSLSVEDNPGLCSTASCTSSKKKKKKSFVAPVVAIAALVVLLSAGFISFLVFRRRRKAQKTTTEITAEVLAEREIQEPGYNYDSKRKGGLARFSYSDVQNMTRYFQRELGKGGFGVVYYGCLKDGTEVAVKILSQTIHASEQFSTEVELLMAIRHKNLVSLVGYCEEGAHLALIFEYMARGNLQTVLSATHSLTWKERLQIAIDAAQGLDYLHTGCRPPIVHRDVKTPNILLNMNLQAKIADFGLSKIFPDENRSYVSTRVMGTPGYLDPEYHVTQQLNEKSDVYSFGVVLLELITGKPAIMKTEERASLVQWASSLLERGDIWSIIDEKLQEVHNPNSLWRSTDIAMACVGPTSAGRPTMSQIVTELKECLAMELDPANPRAHGPDDSIDMSPVISSTVIGPAAR